MLFVGIVLIALGIFGIDSPIGWFLIVVGGTCIGTS